MVKILIDCFFSFSASVEGRTGVYKIQEADMRSEVVQDVLKWMYSLKIDNLNNKVRLLFYSLKEIIFNEMVVEMRPGNT
jgi:hypothetical protein